jgi:hypothetical protein
VGFHNALERQRSARCQQLGGSCRAEEKRNRVIHRALLMVVRTTVKCMTLALASALALSSAVALAQGGGGGSGSGGGTSAGTGGGSISAATGSNTLLNGNTINGTRGVPGSNAHDAASRGHSGKAMRHQYIVEPRHPGARSSGKSGDKK